MADWVSIGVIAFMGISIYDYFTGGNLFLKKLSSVIPGLGGSGGNIDPIQSLQEAAGIRSAPGEGMNLAQQIEKITPSKPGGGIGLDFSKGGGLTRGKFVPGGIGAYADADNDGGVQRIRFSNGATITNFG